MAFTALARAMRAAAWRSSPVGGEVFAFERHACSATVTVAHAGAFLDDLGVFRTRLLVGRRWQLFRVATAPQIGSYVVDGGGRYLFNERERGIVKIAYTFGV
jgi:hypothetical protein